MSSLEFPAVVPTSVTGVQPDSSNIDNRRMMVDARPFQGAYNAQPAQGAFSGLNVAHRFFMNGSNWDLSQATGPATFTITFTGTQFIVYGVMLEMVTSRSAVFNGASFGGQFLGGLLNLTTLTPGALANGLLLRVTSGGLTTQVAQLNVNEDFGLSSYPMAGGSLTGGAYTLRSRYEMRQPILSGTSDNVVWQVQDNMTGRGITELRAIAYGQVT